MIRSYKIRIYPTEEQERLMWKHIDCRRYIWNYMLELQETRYANGEKHLSAFDMIKLITPLKKDGEHEWLKEVSNKTLQITCRDLDEAYQRFFKQVSEKPKFKVKKKAKAGFPVCQDHLYFENGSVNMEKIGKVKYETDFEFPEGRGFKYKNPRVKYKNGKWMLSFGKECENQAFQLSDKRVGIDLGIKELAVVAIEDEQMVFHNINKSKRVKFLKRQLVHTQRSASRKYEANKQVGKLIKTNNIKRLEDKESRISARIANIRDNYIHQITHTIVSMLPKQVTMEDLNVSGMMKNKHLSRAIQEQCFYKFIFYMRYKCEEKGINFVQVGKFYPSSKTCSSCGNIKIDLKLSDRTYKCPVCGLEIDRDYNAAMNLMRYTA